MSHAQGTERETLNFASPRQAPSLWLPKLLVSYSPLATTWVLRESCCKDTTCDASAPMPAAPETYADEPDAYNDEEGESTPPRSQNPPLPAPHRARRRRGDATDGEAPRS